MNRRSIVPAFTCGLFLFSGLASSAPVRVTVRNLALGSARRREPVHELRIDGDSEQ
jgi:hypothetical protein